MFTNCLQTDRQTDRRTDGRRTVIDHNSSPRAIAQPLATTFRVSQPHQLQQECQFGGSGWVNSASCADGVSEADECRCKRHLSDRKDPGAPDFRSPLSFVTAKASKLQIVQAQAVKDVLYSHEHKKGLQERGCKKEAAGEKKTTNAPTSINEDVKKAFKQAYTNSLKTIISSSPIYNIFGESDQSKMVTPPPRGRSTCCYSYVDTLQRSQLMKRHVIIVSHVFVEEPGGPGFDPLGAESAAARLSASPKKNPQHEPSDKKSPFQLNIKSAGFSHTICPICNRKGARSEGFVTIPGVAIMQLFINKNILLKKKSRCCNTQMSGGKFTPETLSADIQGKIRSTTYMEPEQISSLINSLRQSATQRQKSCIDFDDPSTMTDADYWNLTRNQLDDDDDDDDIMIMHDFVDDVDKVDNDSHDDDNDDDDNIDYDDGGGIHYYDVDDGNGDNRDNDDDNG
ncbi:hypothetical protein DPMN_109015 [Dreissena polymorpha]|uniref:Uncharacterized protein n=1 Tax=Dreissena polymorpha TaxID=45954 RepID=A0A9D4K9I5_DREPO|nr:hypothetical protein DPMN_109015 [Dreissena polymorpha]